MNPEKKTFFGDAPKAPSEAGVKGGKERRKKSLPEKYDLKYAENSPLDPKGDVERITALSREYGLTNEQSQKLYEAHHAMASGLVSRQQQSQNDTFENLKKEWETQTWADKDLGGDKRTETEANIARVRDRFAPLVPNFFKLADESGYGNHPEFVRFISVLGRMMAEDKPLSIVGGGGNKGQQKTLAERMYPNTAAS